MSKLAKTSCTSSLSSSASTIRSTLLAPPRRSVIGTRFSDTIGVSADSIVKPAASSASRDLVDRRRLGRHAPRAAVVGDVVGAGVERGEHQLVLVRRSVDLDDPRAG